MSSFDKSSGSKPFLSVQTIVLFLITWAIAALLFFLLFSVTPPGEARPAWYSWGTSIFELVAYLIAALLCFRNWRSSQIVSGRNVWLGIGLGMAFYFTGSLLFTWWELIFDLQPDVSVGDFFFIPAYVCLIGGMVSAVFSRRLNLEIWQWGVVAAIAAIGIGLATWLTVETTPATAHQLLWDAPAYAQTAPATKPPQRPSKPLPASPVPTAQATPKAPSTTTPAPAEPKTEPVEAGANAPQWAKELDLKLIGLKGPLSLFYIICDVILLILATTLLLAFWGGRFSQSWRMLAAAAFFLYASDMWFKYATRDPNYQSGHIFEVGWVLSGVLFAIGAALEYDMSSRSRRSGRRRA